MRPAACLIALILLVFATTSTHAGAIDLVVNAYATYDDVITPIPTKFGDTNPTQVIPGSIVTYEIAVAVDPDAAHPEGNMGLATIVFDVLQCGAFVTEEMEYITAAESGYAVLPGGAVSALRDVTQPMYVDPASSYIGYYGGWGFDNSGLPIGGNVTAEPGSILGAGALAPLTWTSDVDHVYFGLQPYARLGVGIGTYYFGEHDPACAGLQGGFGQDLSNASAVVPGDGHWLMFRSTIDTSGWATGTDYGWNVEPTNGAVYSPTVDYSQDQGGGFRIAVYEEDMAGDSFAFFLVPEPVMLGPALLCIVAIVRRRR
jgi:hypothetical protein